MSRSAGPRGSRQKHSCLNCRRRKVKCNFAIPCSACARSGQSDDCIRYPPMVLGKGLLAPKLYRTDGSNANLGTAITNGVSRPKEDSSGLRCQKGVKQLHSAMVQSASALAGVMNLQERAIRLCELSPIASLLLPSTRLSFFLSLLPSKRDCDMLLDHYIKNLDWVYHCNHWPSFLEAYSSLWSCTLTNVKPGWLCLLLVILTTACLNMPKSLLETLNITAKGTLELSDTFFEAYLQCRLIAESQPCVELLQAFLAAQTYLLQTKKPKLLQSLLASSIRQAQLLEMDKEKPDSNYGGVEAEMRRRVWWDLYVCDTYHSLRIGLAPLVASNVCNIPLPANCNDSDITKNSITLFPDNVPTISSCSRFRARLMQIMSKVFRAPSDEISSLSFRLSLQQELEDFRENLPWYFSLAENGKLPPLMPGLEYIHFQHYVLDAAASIHKFRNLFKFCSTSTNARNFCRDSVMEASLVFNAILKDPALNCDPKMSLALNQSFSVSMMQYMYITFEAATREEMSILRDNINKRMNLSRHLETLIVLPENVTESKDVISEMLNMKGSPKSSVSSDTGNQSSQELAASQITGQFGSRPDIEEYINKAAIRYMLNNDNSTGNSAPPENANTIEYPSKDYLGRLSQAPAPNNRKVSYLNNLALAHSPNYPSSAGSDEVVGSNFDWSTWDETLYAYTDYFMEYV